MEQSTVEIPHYDMLINEYEVYEYLNKLGKEDLVFNYNNIKSFEDLQLFSQSILNQSVLGVNNTHNTPFTVSYTNFFEKEKSLEAVKQGLTNIKLDDVKYTVSSLGYRLVNPLETIHKSIGVFGCSITYGIGMPENKLFTNLLQEHIKEPIHNFGIPGASVQKVAKSFISINNFYKLKKAIIILPALHRFEHMGEDLIMGKNLLFSESYIPGFEPVNKNRREVWKTVYSTFGDIAFFDQFIRTITLIVQNAKINKTELHFYSWDYQVVHLAKKYKVEDLGPIMLLHFPENQEAVQGKKVFDFARDGAHPGLRSQKSMYETLLSAFREKKML